ncbi:formylglycine-generating enzyme family protein [Falsihalocynthiibacter sp. SS001]|uniref:formylglycine-generating enzyme family protein n=1 Tax=Falsihalocynthiibacter sp. SS001 TaxID=3349698 RepID=UPI0036D284E6
MSAAPKSNHRLKTFIGLAVLGLSAAAIVGGVQMKRAPDFHNMPVMAERPIVMPDGHAIYVQRYEVTVAEWNQCHEQGACTLNLRARPDQLPSTTPATGLSYVDAQEYVAWMNAASGRKFRLPTAEEWNYMAAPVLPETPDPIFTDPSLTWASSYLTEGLAPRALKPQGSFSQSPQGIADLDGSVWEWTQECYAGAGDDITPDRCPAFIVGGEHIAAMSYLIRDPARGGCAAGTPPAHLGMRLVADEAV